MNKSLIMMFCVVQNTGRWLRSCTNLEIDEREMMKPQLFFEVSFSEGPAFIYIFIIINYCIFFFFSLQL